MKERNMSTLLNTHQVAAAFGVTTMTLANWRKGSPKRSPLPTAKQPKNAQPLSIWYAPSALKVWAKKNGIEVPKSLDTLTTPTPTKPGPKVGMKVSVDASASAAKAKAPSKPKKPAATPATA